MDDDVTHQPQQFPPLTWDEARIRLRLTMEQWKSEDQKKKKATTVTNNESTVIAAATTTTTTTTTTTKTKRKSLCLRLLRSKMDDPDDIIYLTIPLCILFVALSYTTTLPNIITDASTHPQQHITQQQQKKVASILYLLTILASTYISYRRKKMSRETDRSIERRRCVSTFLQEMKTSCSQHQHQQQQQQQQQQQYQSQGGFWNDCAIFQDTIPRKNVEDVYSTYRLSVNNNTTTNTIITENYGTNQNLINSDSSCGSNDTQQQQQQPRQQQQRHQQQQQQQQQSQGQWHRIPSLLLVQGDYIAMKVGDTAPAKCILLQQQQQQQHSSSPSVPIPRPPSSLLSSMPPYTMNTASSIIVAAGERLTIESLSLLAKVTLGLNHSNDNVVDSMGGGSQRQGGLFNVIKKAGGGGSSSSSQVLLPPGRSTMTYHSNEMLLLANGVQIFILLETPLDTFLRKEINQHNPKQYDDDDNNNRGTTTMRQPQVVRQLNATRCTLALYAIFTLLVCTLLLLVRRSITTYWSLPLLSTLCVLPVSMPIFLFWVECIGISRILATVHPLASKRKETHADGNHTTTDTKVEERSMYLVLNATGGGNDEYTKGRNPHPYLLLRYIMATSTYRLFTNSLIKKLTSVQKRLLGTKHSSSSSSSDASDRLLSIPPASLYLLEKLGLVTALALVDDELACEPYSTPQQLLIPSGQGGFTLLDICPVYDDDDDDDDNDEEDYENNVSNRDNDGVMNTPPPPCRIGRPSILYRTTSSGSGHHRSSSASVDSDESNDETRYRFNHAITTTAATAAKAVRTMRSYRLRNNSTKHKGNNRPSRQQKQHQHGGNNVHHELSLRHKASVDDDDDEEDDVEEVQFEDPEWWKHLPSLKCIGLAALLLEERKSRKNKSSTLDVVPQIEAPQRSESPTMTNPSLKVSFDTNRPRSSSDVSNGKSSSLSPVEISLVDHICCDERERKHLKLLAQCIGFETTPTNIVGGGGGDLSCFIERRRLHILSTSLLRERLQLEWHALGIEDNRNWSRLYTDADAIIVRDKRSGGDLVLTIGNSRIVTHMCTDLWQGENSTISPLSVAERNIINETQKNWELSDLDVQAFSYAPLPFTAEQKIDWGGNTEVPIYLLDNAIANAYIPSHGFWSLVKNQIFLGLLGSAVRPRKVIEPLINSCTHAGVRFVYFSPRNMRRTKELASQMGIDVGWNCAISLRPLEEGSIDSYRMSSNYADWDINARLPHGVDDVRRHLQEVDNVPLLVSLYTDITKKTAADMVNVFQDYNDTVLSVGMSHLPGNQEIFSSADIAIGVDVLAEDVTYIDDWNALQEEEITFVTSISAHSSVFNLCGSRATRHFEEILRIGRASLEAASSGVTFYLSGCLSFSIFTLLCSCTAATAIPTIPTIGYFLFTQMVLPMIGLSMVSTDESEEFMTCVPPKNDLSVKYSLMSNRRQYVGWFVRSSIPAILTQFLYLIVLGELMWEFDPQFVLDNCLDSADVTADAEEQVKFRQATTSIIRCSALQTYSGPATDAAGIIMLSSLVICTIMSSASYIFRNELITSEPPWKRNHLWFGTVLLSLTLVILYMAVVLERGTMAVLSWLTYVLFVVFPFLCLYCCETMKKREQKIEKRAAKMRRLQFETRLGMWSPKESNHLHSMGGVPQTPDNGP